MYYENASRIIKCSFIKDFSPHVQKSARERFHTKLRRGAGFDRECNFNAIFIWLFLTQRFHNLFWCYQQLVSWNILYLIILHYLTPLMYFFEWLPELKNDFKYTHQQSCNLFVRKEMVLKWFFNAIGISSLNTFCNQKIVQVRLCSCSFNRMIDNFISSERVAKSASKVRIFSQNFYL